MAGFDAWQGWVLSQLCGLLCGCETTVVGGGLIVLLDVWCLGCICVSCGGDIFQSASLACNEYCRLRK